MASRRGLTITEIMVVIALLLTMSAIMLGGIRSVLELEQRQAARDLSMLYAELHDEAVLRNVTFRLAFNLTAGSYEVQVGEPGTIIFDNQQDRERFEEDMRARLAAMTEEEKAEWRSHRQPFERLQESLKREYTLPSSMRIAGVYTPQYDEMVMREDEPDEEGPQIVYSYVFANGFAEHAVIWLAEGDTQREGYTIEIEPMSGVVHLHPELRDWDTEMRFLPTRPPRLSN